LKEALLEFGQFGVCLDRLNRRRVGEVPNKLNKDLDVGGIGGHSVWRNAVKREVARRGANVMPETQ
jgi:hypothetical protein